jgi:hypothetical protein
MPGGGPTRVQAGGLVAREVYREVFQAMASQNRQQLIEWGKRHWRAGTGSFGRWLGG